MSNKGSHAIARALVAQEKLVSALALLDFNHSEKKLLEVLSAFPGLLQMLPWGRGSNDFLDIDIWEKLQKIDGDSSWVMPDADVLKDCKNVLASLNNFSLDHEHILYVAGKGRETPMGIKIVPDKHGKSEIYFKGTHLGDGRVTWASGIPEDVEHWYVNASHGELASYTKAFQGYKELISSGHTSSAEFSKNPIVQRGESEKSFLMPADAGVNILPDESMLLDLVFGTENRLEKRQSLKPVLITISHGDICFVSDPLVLGHYNDDVIVSAEKVVDRQFGGRLRKRMLLGLYPGALNTAEVISNPKKYGKPGAAIIIGLGQMGKLTRSKLSATFNHAALQYALSVVEASSYNRNNIKATEMKLCCLLIGTGTGGISIEDAVTALIEGIIDANVQLQKKGYENVQFTELEFIERWEDIANAAAHAIGAIGFDTILRKQITYIPALSLGSIKDRTCAKVNTREGARSRTTIKESEGWWRRIQIYHDKDTESLKFSVLTDKARAEVSLKAIDLKHVDDFLKIATGSGYNNPDIRKTLFEMIVPHEIKEQTPNQEDVVLVLNKKAARYPWELLQDRWASRKHGVDRGDAKPISVAYGMIRQLETDRFRIVSNAVMQDDALVIGNPPGNPNQFPSLPGAAREAREVNKILLQNGYDVNPIISEDTRPVSGKIMLALHAKTYRIMHFAGHGVYELDVDDNSELCDLCGQTIDKEKKTTGMVIGDNIFLTPGNIESIRHVPDLVFINCCHLGKEEGKDTPQDRYKLAANLATQFIEQGVKAVIATGWAVNDSAAETFATTFYECMLNRCRFGEAVHKAREKTYNNHASTNTWGAYQCYGNPDFQLDQKQGSSSRGRQQCAVSESELVSIIEQHRQDAKLGGNDKKVNDDLDKLVKATPDDWRGGRVLSALGRAYAEVGNTAKSVTYFQKSLEKDPDYMPIKAREQLANMYAKRAVELWKDSGKTQEENRDHRSDDYIEKSIALLNQLRSLGETSERYCLLGSTYKRSAWIKNAQNQVDCLLKMKEYYKLAKSGVKTNNSELVSNHSNKINPFHNYVTSCMILNWSGRRYNLKSRLSELRQQLDQNNSPDDFWKLVERADYRLLDGLINAEIGQNADAIGEGYNDAKIRFGSARELNSVIEHIEFLIHMAESLIKNTVDRATITCALESILTSIREG